MLSTHVHPRLAPVRANDSRELHFRTASIAIIARRPNGHLQVFESTFTDRVFRELNRIARDGERIAGMIWGNSALDRSSIRALNVYLETMGGVRWPQKNRASHLTHGVHKWAWESFCALVGLRWVS